MKKQRLTLLLCAVAGLAFTSCAPLYLPNAANTPLLTNQGEFQAAFHSSTAGLETQFAFAATDNVGLLLNASFPINEDIDQKYPFIEAGAGYYTSFGSNGVFEVYGGGGYRSLGEMGADDYYDNGDNGYEYGSTELLYYTRLFVQPTIGGTFEVFDGSFTPRVVLVNIVDSEKSRSGFFVEPIVTAKVGYKYVKFVIQGGVSIPFSQTMTLDYQPLIIAVGMQVSLNRLYH